MDNVTIHLMTFIPVVNGYCDYFDLVSVVTILVFYCTVEIGYILIIYMVKLDIWSIIWSQVGSI